MEKKRILFVSHDASRTGAPIVLKHLLQWMKQQPDVEFSILIKDGGDIDIEDDLRAIAPVYKWSPDTPPVSLEEKLSARVNRRLLNREWMKSYPAELKAQQFDLVYMNTAATTKLAPYLKQYHNCPIILHVHENEYSIKAHYPQSLNEEYRRYIDHYIAVSKSTRQNLTDNFGIPAENISQVNEFVPVSDLKKPTKPAKQVKDELAIQDEFVVGASGVAGWRKGVDLFIRAALIIKKMTGPKIRFVWVGHTGHFFDTEWAYEQQRLGLTKNEIIFTGSVTDPENYFQVFDVFALTSREDPFPLVNLEAAAQGKPIICFDQTGGGPELLAGGGGIIVPYADPEALADAITALYHDKARREQLSAEIKNIIQPYDVSVQAPKILAVIKAQLKK